MLDAMPIREMKPTPRQPGLWIVMSLLVTPVFPIPAIARPTHTAEPAPLVVTTAADSGPGSLRQAILDANNQPGGNTIRFNVAGELPVRIAPASQLPVATEAVVIDATTQPGYDGAPVVEISGSDSVDVGLELLGGASTVRGLVVNRFVETGIRLTFGNNVVEACYVGTDVTGTIALPNWISGIEASGSGNRIGGTSPGAGNVISGNGGRPEFGGGVYLLNSPGAVVQGNAIGMDVTRSRPLGNAGAGVRIRSSRPVLIGGLEASAANLIAFNASTGVYTDFGFQISVLGNSIFGNGSRVLNFNGKYGIHNDNGAGPSTPMLVSVSEGDVVRVRGAIWFTRSSLYGFGPVRFELFRNRDCSELGYGQGAEFLGAVEGERRASQVVTFEADLPVTLEAGETLTCTATVADGSTSAFSNCLTDTGGCELPFARNLSSSTSVRSGERVTLEADVSGSEPIAYQWLESDPNVGPPRPIPGETGRTFMTPPVSSPLQYQVEARNGCGEVQAYLGVAPCSDPPRIDTQPVSVTAVRGTLVALSAAIPFGAVATYRWYAGRRGDTAQPVPDEPGAVGTLVFRQVTESGRYWCRVTNACGSVDSDDAAITVVAPMEITSVAIQVNTSGAPRLVARGSSIPTDVQISIIGAVFEKPAKVRSNRIVQRGGFSDGRSLDEGIPRGATTRLFFYSPARGSVTIEYARP